MKKIHFTKAFKRDYKTIVSRGLDADILMQLVQLLAEGKKLPDRYKRHRLHGKWKDFYEYHLNPDWLLIWSEDKGNIYLTRTGSHADLF